MDSEIWAIRVILETGDNMLVCTDREAAELAHHEWVEAVEGYSEGGRQITIIGFTDTADRAPLTLSFCPEVAKTVAIWKMYDS